jgi:RNA-binding protein YhbY
MNASELCSNGGSKLQVIKPIYEEMKAQLGAAAAQDIIKAAIAKSATDAAQEFAAEVGGKTNMSTFQDIFKHWLKGGALEKEGPETR